MEDLVYRVHALLLGHLPVKSNRTPSGWVTFDCPMCSDKRKRAGIVQSSAKISYNCFNCGYKTGWSPSPFIGKKYKQLAERLGASDNDIHTVYMDLLKHSEELEHMVDQDYVFSFNKFDTIELPDETVDLYDLPANHEIVQYAKDRGVYGLCPLYWVDNVLYKKRLLIPFLYNNELVGWTGRHIAPPDKNTPKYYHSLPKGYVYNIDRFAGTDRSIVIVTEGVFDAILVDGVSILGNRVTPEQAHLIEQLNARIIVCPDRDEAGKELIKQSIALGWEVSFPPWANDVKDAADACAKYGRVATVASIIKHATNNNIKKEVMMRMT
jgi:hypothetical protein